MRGHTLGAFVKLVIFAVVTAFLTAVLATTIAGGTVGGRYRTYHAVFKDATDLIAGDDVRIAGVRVGSVSAVQVYHRKYAEVTFSVQSDIPVYGSTVAQLRYQNLLGQRYLELMEAPGNGQALRPGGWLPMAQTRPALDLTALFNGFRPLFQGLDPTATNRFAYEIVRTLQGEGGTFDQLLANTSSLTNTIANQDAAVGALIDNLNVVLATVDARSQGLGELIDQLQRLVTGLASNRQTIAAALGNVNLLTVKTASLLQGIRPPLPADLGSLSGLAHTLATTRYPDRRVILAEFLRWMPWKLNTIIRTATYGSFFNFWLCNADVWTPPHNGMGGYSQRSHTNGETEPGHKTAVRPDPACDAP